MYLQMTQAVCFLDLLLFTLDGLLSAYGFTLFQSEEILVEPSQTSCGIPSVLAWEFQRLQTEMAPVVIPQ